MDETPTPSDSSPAPPSGGPRRGMGSGGARAARLGARVLSARRPKLLPSATRLAGPPRLARVPVPAPGPAAAAPAPRRPERPAPRRAEPPAPAPAPPARKLPKAYDGLSHEEILALTGDWELAKQAAA